MYNLGILSESHGISKAWQLVTYNKPNLEKFYSDLVKICFYLHRQICCNSFTI